MLSAEMASEHTRDLMTAAAAAYPVRSEQDHPHRPLRRRAQALAARLRTR